jgi:methionine sulfoxide reductase heme-binding subunit
MSTPDAVHSDRGILPRRVLLLRRDQDVALKASKVLLFLVCLIPLAELGARIATDTLGANPVEAVLHFTGLWALRLLLATLAVTPLRRLTGWAWLIRLRRMLGLFAFFYAVLHFAVYLVLDRELAFGEIVTDLTKRPYIIVGFAALVLLVPLAVTSTRGWVRRLGRRWQTLHRLVYVIAILAVLHFCWLVKADLYEPLIYGAVLAVLLAARLPFRRLGLTGGRGRHARTAGGG